MNTSRRSFFKAAAAVAGIGIMPKFANASVPQKWDAEYDVVVIGFGGAGANAAVSAHDNGSKVLILEKLPEPGGNTSVSSGNFLWCKDPQKVRAYFTRLFDLSHCELDQDLLHTYTDKMQETVDWLKKLEPEANIRVVNRSSFPHIPDNEAMYCCTVMGEKGSGGGPNLFGLYRRAVEKRNIPVWLGSPALQLIIDDGVVKGVVVQKDGKKLNVRAAQGVVLSCGGYEYDEESKRNFNLGDPILTLGCPGNTGDGLRMPEAAGAGIWHTSGLSCPLGTKVPGHTASQAFNTKQTGYILVDQNGKRFINEKQIEHHAGILAVNYFDSYEMKYPRIPCYAIFDANSKEDGAFAPSYGSGWLRHREKWNWSRSNDKEIEAGIVKVGQNIQELAEKIGVDAKNLQATIGQWNSDLKGPEKKDSLFGRTLEGHVGQVWPHGASKKQSSPLDKPPYYAIELFPAILNTQGGPRHNSKSQVLNPFGQPIPRLYVAGELGSFWGFIYQGCGNNAEALIFGRIAGEEASKEKRWS